MCDRDDAEMKATPELNSPSNDHLKNFFKELWELRKLQCVLTASVWAFRLSAGLGERIIAIENGGVSKPFILKLFENLGLTGAGLSMTFGTTIFLYELFGVILRAMTRWVNLCRRQDNQFEFYQYYNKIKIDLSDRDSDKQPFWLAEYMRTHYLNPIIESEGCYHKLIAMIKSFIQLIYDVLIIGSALWTLTLGGCFTAGFVGNFTLFYKIFSDCKGLSNHFSIYRCSQIKDNQGWAIATSWLSGTVLALAFLAYAMPTMLSKGKHMASTLYLTISLKKKNKCIWALGAIVAVMISMMAVVSYAFMIYLNISVGMPLVYIDIYNILQTQETVNLLLVISLGTTLFANLLSRGCLLTLTILYACGMQDILTDIKDQPWFALYKQYVIIEAGLKDDLCRETEGTIYSALAALRHTKTDKKYFKETYYKPSSESELPGDIKEKINKLKELKQAIKEANPNYENTIRAIKYWRKAGSTIPRFWGSETSTKNKNVDVKLPDEVKKTDPLFDVLRMLNIQSDVGVDDLSEQKKLANEYLKKHFEHGDRTDVTKFGFVFTVFLVLEALVAVLQSYYGSGRFMNQKVDGFDIPSLFSQTTINRLQYVFALLYFFMHTIFSNFPPLIKSMKFQALLSSSGVVKQNICCFFSQGASEERRQLIPGDDLSDLEAGPPQPTIQSDIKPSQLIISI